MLLKAEVLECKVLEEHKTVAQLQTNKTFITYQNLIKHIYNLGYREMPIEMQNVILAKLNHDNYATLANNNQTSFQSKKLNDADVASASNGLFDEEIKETRIQKIHKTVFDSHTRRITKFDLEGTTYNNYTTDPVVAAMSVDPLTAKYPYYTPYQFAGNKPIVATDIDGLEPNYSASSVPEGDVGIAQIAPNAVDRDDNWHAWVSKNGSWANVGLAPPPLYSFPTNENVADETKDRAIGPYQIEQHGSNLCGITICGQLMAQYDPEGYKKLVNDLYTTGSGQYGNLNLTGNGALYDATDNYDYKSDGSIAAADWILLSAMKKQSGILGYGGNWFPETLEGITTPSEVKSVITQAGFTVYKYTMSTPSSPGWSVGGLKSYLDEQQKNGRSTVFLINSKILDGETDFPYFGANHYVIYSGGFQIDEKNQTVQFRVQTWGESNRQVDVPIKVFLDSFYGYMTVGK